MEYEKDEITAAGARQFAKLAARHGNVSGKRLDWDLWIERVSKICPYS